MERELDESLRWDAGSVRAHRQLALYNLEVGRLQAATAQLARAQTAEGPGPLALMALGAASWQDGRGSEAVGFWRKGGAARLVGAYAGEALHKGDPVQAEQYYRVALAVDADQASLWSGLADAQQHLGREEEAITSMQRAFALGLADAQAADDLGRLLLSRRRYNEGVTWFRRALDLHPGYTSYLIDLADGYHAAGNPAAAIETNLEAVRGAPTNGWAHAKLGAILAENGEVARGVEEAKTGTDLAPGFREAWVTLGAVYLYWQRDPDAAIGALHRALAIDASYTITYDYLAQAYLAKGDRANARAEYAAIVKLDPTNARARDQFESLRPSQ